MRPNLRFSLLDQGIGYDGGRSHTLALARGSTDAALAFSLFSHLGPDAALGYLRELARVLFPEGAAIVTLFILDEPSRGSAGFTAVKVGVPIKKEAGFWYFSVGGYADIYYRKAVLRRLAEEAGLELIALRRGDWYRPGSADIAYGAHQDVLMLRTRPGGRP